MKLGARLCPCFRQGGTFEEFVTFCAGLDLDAVDCSELTPETAECCERHNILVGSVDGMFFELQSDDAEERAKGLASAKKRVDEIADNGGTVMFTAIGAEDPHMTRAQAFENWKQCWPELVSHAESRGVGIAVEPWPGPGAPRYKATLGCTPEMLRAMFEFVSSPALGLCYDPSHFVRLRIDYLRILDEFGSRVKHVHLKDTAIIEEGLYEYGTLGPCLGEQPYAHGGGYWRYTIPGDGAVDWERVLKRLKGLGYEGVCSIELEDHFYRDSPELQREGITNSARYIRGLLES
jgi:sugar phosphate isomerase/epimerase